MNNTNLCIECKHWEGMTGHTSRNNTIGACSVSLYDPDKSGQYGLKLQYSFDTCSLFEKDDREDVK